MTDQSKNPGPSGYSEKDVHREVTELQEKSATAARIFDLRRIIGGLFVLYGIIVTITGITDDQAAIDKAQGVNINLWTGIAMLILGIFFLAWLKLRPTPPPTPDTAEGTEDEPAGPAH
ncbi:hypothetical protein LXH13_23985 [Streptomyces spinosirectus]|jgi:hypothetical protein|uniref:hypothetical protein n=1 Tax=Streptomyces TaxID=1883 RepID=UPI000D3B20E2|nr:MULTISPECIES: hypothetical protein [Streptomyces]MBY8345453.1 hypothetical protein [Streptomyces plumbidurans]PTM97920.1 hypothetical protein C7821_103131 [Streptomyces sp. VMFN-G11Ma]UIR19914.1 hypothetical protein LXH13_23985 [Streptomyces spinosirectus]